MKIATFTLIVMIGIVFLVIGCGSKTKLNLSTNPQIRKGELKAEATVQSCMKHTNFFTHSGRQNFIKCVSPPGKQAQVESCIQHQLASANLFTHNGRQKLSVNVSNCLIQS